MNNIETYWAIANQTISMLNILVEGWLFTRFVKPFIKGKTYYVGLSYSIVMLVFYCVPEEISYPKLQGVLVAWIVMCLIERKNRKQKVFLATLMYLLRWVVYGVTLVLRDIMFVLCINTSYMLTRPIMQFVAYIIVELIYYGVAITVMYLVIKFVHLEYTWLRVIYQIVSFAAILIAIVIYQKLKEKQRDEKENILLAEQLENTKQHIREVEKLYGDIRALKHDMGNHIAVLESLFMKNETEELERYFGELKSTWHVSMKEIKTGNPVTDVILTQKQKEAEEKEIDFRCKFHYPIDTNINAFDVSVILNNAIENAIEGISGCHNPYVSISAYRKKNAHMLEVTNCVSKHVEIDTETGLPETTKKDTDSHGFGLANIRKVAQKYYGDIDISQDENKFTLTVMLMIE